MTSISDYAKLKEIQRSCNNELDLVHNIMYLPARTKDATDEMNPERNELKGKVPTRQQ